MPGCCGWPGLRIRSNGWNIFLCSSALIPGPVSFTVNSATWLRYFTLSETPPVSVYFTAFDKRLVRIWRRCFSSVRTISGKYAGASYVNVMPLATDCRRNISARSFNKRLRLTSSRRISSRPASMRDRSSKPSIRSARYSPLLRIRLI